MAVATFSAVSAPYPYGNDNTQRHQRQSGLFTIVGDSPSYVQGGCRINFSSLEAIKASSPYLLPVWLEAVSWGGSTGIYVYRYAPLGAVISNLVLTSNVVTITCHNNLAAGDVVLLSGLTTSTDLNGLKLTVLANSLTATAFTASLTHANINNGAETGFCTPVSYASGLPFQGNLQIFQAAGSAAPLVELSTAGLPSGVTADSIAFRAEFVRV